ncbi:MAG: fatty acid desaturase [Planctomycetes bacterium]|nr:fatty acid desaturase [Planctomycetota bacterium]
MATKERYYFQHIGDLRERLLEHLSTEDLRGLHQIQPWRHFLIAGRHLALFLLCAWTLYVVTNPWIWVPVAALQGINILGFIILLHEQVHTLIFKRKHPLLQRLLGLAYALPSAISASQFDIWHNDHHRELGSTVTDPKRAHLSPKRNARWYKLLYCTPALFVIYAIAAKKEAATYPPELRRRIRNERLANIAIHLSFAAALGFHDAGALLRVYLVPFLAFFPPAFMLNRLGQHYDINPKDNAAWSTLVTGNPLTRFLFLHSNHHIEHHYYPAVPFYRLPELNRRLRPFFRASNIPNRTYPELIYGWFVKNRTPHTDWDLA